MKNCPFLLLSFFLLCKTQAQSFDQLPSLEGDLNDWHLSISQDSQTPIMKGVYFYEDEARAISIKEHPFFGEVWDINGSLSFEERYFKKINLAYNIKKDLLLVWDWDIENAKTKSLQIDQSKVDSFRVHNQKFVHAKYTGLSEDGFYAEILQGNKITCYAKKWKTSEINGAEIYFTEKSKYFIIYKNEIYDYRKKSALYKIFPDQKKQLKNYFKAIGNVFDKDNDYHTMTLLKYCESIVP